ncbi:MAG: hypothetical protein NXI26_26505 [bacterium]|uniref:BPL/LPL catalytic domain-containing protein n=1 Tax=Phaeodactylibacter xiamenensis TaxID=1524460 RepID=A0A098RXF1_9BACT|nr:hypothetical protein [Phaeodactylibacter xiamenensis]KGE84839.1 hypothetical protein IX84_31440 [Phaeodactylibacter xiamenensis]MCR9055421.1 hypothetical protein [bacterium]
MNNNGKEAKKNSIWLEYTLKTISGILVIVVVAVILHKLGINKDGEPTKKEEIVKPIEKTEPTDTKEVKTEDVKNSSVVLNPTTEDERPNLVFELSGIILDYENNDVVGGAKVFYGDKIMTTNPDGTFKISTPSKEGKKIRILKEGYAEYTDYITPPHDNLTIKIRKK